MIARILLGVVVVAIAFVIVVATRPSRFHIERSIAVLAPPENVFAQINNFHNWAAWSPWEKLDLQMQKTFSGPASGAGAGYAWRSENGKVGQGQMTIERSDRPSLVRVKLEFIKPFAATNTVTFTIARAAENATVTWAMDGHNGFLGKMFHLVMNMDKMVGGDFGRGLAALKSVAEASPRPSAVAGMAAAQ